MRPTTAIAHRYKQASNHKQIRTETADARSTHRRHTVSQDFRNQKCEEFEKHRRGQRMNQEPPTGADAHTAQALDTGKRLWPASSPACACACVSLPVSPRPAGLHQTPAAAQPTPAARGTGGRLSAWRTAHLNVTSHHSTARHAVGSVGQATRIGSGALININKQPGVFVLPPTL